MSKANKQDAITLGAVLCEIMREHNLDEHEIGSRLDVTYQTVKNVLRGKSANVKFVRKLIDTFNLQNDPRRLRRLLIGYLAVQFEPEEAGRLLEIAGLSEE